MDARAFTAAIKAEIAEQLRRFNAELTATGSVRILWRGANRISVSPTPPQSEPPGLTAVKTELARRWPMVALLDLLKEAALDTGFLDAFQDLWRARGERSRDTAAPAAAMSLRGLGPMPG
jgi:hypothetical protein